MVFLMSLAPGVAFATLGTREAPGKTRVCAGFRAGLSELGRTVDLLPYQRGKHWQFGRHVGLSMRVRVTLTSPVRPSVLSVNPRGPGVPVS